jgi:pimeloyl-ACP methyl ester carboxylesterase
VKLNYRDVLRSHASTHRAAIDKEYVINPSQPLVGEPKRNGVVFWSRKTALAILGTLVTLALVGACYQAIQTKVDLRRFPPRGRFVDLGGYKLDINCTGHGSPTVILESELGGLALSWQRVQSGIEKFTRVCSYDRAGYGWSNSGPMPRTSGQIVQELHMLLQRAGEKPPYVLVGHSLGGFNVRVFNGQYRNEVAGMVLVDASHEDQVRDLPSGVRERWDNSVKDVQRQREFNAVLTWLGVTRLMTRNRNQETLHLDLQPKFVNAVRSEFENFDKSAEQVRAAGTLGDKPLIVLTAGKDNTNVVSLPKGFSRQDYEASHQLFEELQVQEVHLSTRGKQIIISDSGHLIPIERPDAVVSAVREVWEAARNF